MTRFRTGLRDPNRDLTRAVPRHDTRMLGGAHRPAPPNYLRQVCALVALLIRSHEREREAQPELFDPERIARQQAERRAAQERFLYDLKVAYGDQANAGLRAEATLNPSASSQSVP